MYHLNTFFLPKNEWAGEGRIQKTIQKQYKISIISTLASPNNSLKKAMKVWVF